MSKGGFINRLSIIVPTLNEADNMSALITRIDAAFGRDKSTYEIIFIDDHSTDATVRQVRKYQDDFPINIFLKEGSKGKARSLIEGFKRAKYQTVAMIDADLQYPPEALPAMVRHLRTNDCDVVIANRKKTQTSLLRQLSSKVFRYGFGKAMFSLDVDIQSGMKVFRKEIIDRITINPEPWMFDLHFLLQARTAGYKIASYDIEFAERSAGVAKVSPLRDSIAMALASLKLWFSQNHYVAFNQRRVKSLGSGFHYKGTEYVTHNTLDRHSSAVERTTQNQRLVLLALLLAVVGLAIFNGSLLLIGITSVITILYFMDLLFNMFLIYRSFQSYSEIVVDDHTVGRRHHWPTYTILCPLYKEVPIVPQFIAAMEAIDYPKSKLEVLLLLEEDDSETIHIISNMNLPKFFKIVVVPNSMPKTKPKACNYGLRMATGDYCVIYDAEDIPDRLQLKKAVLAFDQTGNLTGCIQAKLSYYNWDQNLLTRLFTLEYSLWFNLILTGLQSIKAPIPLGGTSNHFRTNVLRDLGGWDPFNVTEDADLGIRLAKHGLQTAILDSTTMEEANSEFNNWLKQRSRWVKGYMQTYLVHMRDLSQFGKNSTRIDMVTFQLVIGGKVLSMLINPILWIMTVSYFVFRPEIGPFIESIYLTPVFYVGTVALILGNFMYLYYYMMGAARQGRPELIAYAIFVPLYWLMMSLAAYYALRDLLVRPFHWHKTKHGLHLKYTPAAARTSSSPTIEDISI